MSPVAFVHCLFLFVLNISKCITFLYRFSNTYKTLSNAFLCNSRAVLHSTAIVYYLPLSQIFFKTEQIKWFPIQFIQFIQLKQLKPNFIVDYDHFYSHHLISTTSSFFSAMALILIPGNWKKDVWLDNQFRVFFQYSWVKSALPTQTIDLVSPLILQLIDVMYFWDSLSLYSMCSNWRCSSSASAGTGSDTGLFIVQWPIASRTWRLEI